MSDWIHFYNEWFNIKDFCHIWIQARYGKDNGPIEPPSVSGYNLMGEWRHNGEKVIISQDWESLDELRHYMNRKLGIVLKNE